MNTYHSLHMPNLVFPTNFSSFFCLYTKIAQRYMVKHFDTCIHVIEERSIIIFLYWVLLTYRVLHESKKLSGHTHMTHVALDKHLKEQPSDKEITTYEQINANISNKMLE